MSGGSLNYFYSVVEDHVGDFGDKELDDLVADLAELFHDREWYLSSDTGKGDWKEAKEKFKAKWFTDCGRQERIEQYLKEIHDDVMEQFCHDNRRCSNCKHWTRKSDKYGNCEFESRCSMHRSEVCEKWEEDKG